MSSATAGGDDPPPPMARKKSSSAASSAASLFATRQKRSGSAFSKADRRDSMFGQAVHKEGWLEKQSSGAMIKKLQKRYFELVSESRLSAALALARACSWIFCSHESWRIVVWSFVFRTYHSPDIT